MTGTMQMVMGSTSGAVLSFNASMHNDSTSSGVRSASFNLVNDGTSTTGSSPTGGSQSCGPWYSPNPLAGVGSQYYAQLVVGTSTGTTLSGSAVGSVVSMSSGVGWTFASSAATTEGTGSATVSIYLDAGGTQLVGTGNVSWDVGYTP